MEEGAANQPGPFNDAIDGLSQEVADALDDSRLADVLEDSPERIHAEPLPPGPIPGGRRPDDAQKDLVDAKDHQEGPESGHDTNDSTSNRTSTYNWYPEPGFAHIDGDIGGAGYNETTVDVITVPCPGADPLETWIRDPLPDGFFASHVDNEPTTHPALKELAGDAILSPGIGSNLPKAAHLWVRQGIRRYASRARVLLYRHRELTDRTHLDQLAEDLLGNVLLTRDAKQESRPLFFICHSIGGLVVKKALLMASQDDRFRRPILYNCHGVTFFGMTSRCFSKRSKLTLAATPHRGSSYMAMSTLSVSIQNLLHLQRPLPRSLAHDLRVGSKSLSNMHEAFADISSEIRIWSFYETIDSQLSGSGLGIANEVQFTAPLVSIKSALVGVRQEVIYSSLESDHAHCASFGISNPRTLNTYLLDLATAISKAETLSRTKHNSLQLKQRVKIEIIGFYEDPDAGAGLDSDVRLYITKYQLAEFLQRGPERCLEERLRRVPQRPGRPRSRGHASIHRWAHDAGGYVGRVQERLSSMSRSPARQRPVSPGIFVTEPSFTGDGTPSTPAGKQLRSLTIPTSPTPRPGRPISRGSNGTTSTMSEPTGHEGSGKQATSSTYRELHRRTQSDDDRTGLGISPNNRAERLSKALAFRDLTAGFSRPNSDQRKFMWIHLPFTNPLWVKVSRHGLKDALHSRLTGL